MMIKCSTGEVVYSYNAYLQTEHWKATRKRYKDSKYKYKCIACSTANNLNLHHKTYKRVGNERLTDLVWLCKDCHSKVHEHDKQHTSNLWKSTRKAVKKIKKRC